MRKLYSEIPEIGSPATPKTVFIQHCEQTIAAMENKIQELKYNMVRMMPDSCMHKEYEKKINKCYEIIHNSEESIRNAIAHMNLPTHERFRGI